jgi:hypothetical protein
VSDPVVPQPPQPSGVERKFEATAAGLGRLGAYISNEYEPGQRVAVIVHPPDPPEPEPTQTENDEDALFDFPAPSKPPSPDLFERDPERYGRELANWAIKNALAAGGAVPVDPAEQDAATEEER